MSQPLQIQITPALSLRLGRESLRLTPSQGLAVAEELVRKSMRRAMVEAAQSPKPAKLTKTMTGVGK